MAANPRVLVAYDGSDVSRRALQRVARFMSAAEVGPVTVARPIYRDARYTGYADPLDVEEQLHVLGSARDLLEQSGISATGFGPIGDPADEIFSPQGRSKPS